MSETPAATVETEIRQLAKALEAEAAARKGASRAATLVTVVLSCIIVFFVVLNILFFRAQWTEKAFAESLQKQVHELRPLAMQEFERMGKDLLPVFYEEGRSQLAERMPEISETLKSEVTNLGADLVQRVHTRLSRSLDSFSARTEKQISEHYPELTKAGNRAEIEKRVRGIVEGAVVGALADFDRRFGADVDEVKRILLKFDVSDRSDPVDLQKKFLRLWIRLLDLEVMEL